MAFVDYEKAFDSVEIPAVLEAIRKQGVEEVHCKILEDINVIKGRNINNIRYADDTVLISETEKSSLKYSNKVIEVRESLGLSLNTKKTYSMTVSKKSTNSPPTCNLTTNGTDIEQVKRFNYLGSFLTSYGKSNCEINRRIAKRKRSILISSIVNMPTKQRILKCYIWSILPYGCETWSISSVMQKLLAASDMWFLRRILKILWTDKVSNARVLAIANIKFLGHVMRRNNVENLSLTGKVEGKRARGRQKMTYLNNVKEWANTTNGSELIHACQEREAWKCMIVDALAHDT